MIHIYVMELKKDANVLNDAINPRPRVIDLWMKWTMISGKYGLEYVLEDPKGKKEWR